MELLRAFSPDAFAYGLATWSWLGIHGKTPRFTNLFGDVFLESLEGWWFLDTVEGSLELRWGTAVDLYTELDSPDGRADLLLEGILVDALQRVSLRDDEVLTFSPHPALGGRLSADSLEPVRFELALRLAGQMHQQLRVPTPPLLLGHVQEHPPYERQAPYEQQAAYEQYAPQQHPEEYAVPGQAQPPTDWDAIWSR